MQHQKKDYIHLFWDYPDIRCLASSLSREDFRQYIQGLKGKDSIRFNLILRRFIERARLNDLFYFFEPDDVEMALEQFHFWDKLSPIRVHAIKHAIEFIKKRTDALYG
ncbi:MAG: hypothetical protein D6778_01180 [Nitrospirae bacterium]|nr:MAG: hypothetical protein D6778_01180 [Nitrospirota bacterium]